MKPGRSTHAPEIREATNGGEQVMPSRLLSALHLHPKLSRPRRRAADAPQLAAVESQGVAAAADAVAPAARAAEPPKPRRARTPSCVKVGSCFRYTSGFKGEDVPLLRLSGRWLEKHGFSIEGEVYIEAEKGRLILTNYADAAFSRGTLAQKP
jgi:Toxin SymE, type I toxin-antitoxin system